MEKIELQEIIDACEEAESDYVRLFRPLLGYEDELEFYRGIDDTLEPALNDLEDIVGIVVPADLVKLYLISNGGKYFDIDLFRLTNDKNDPNGLYYNNANSELREKYNIPSQALIIGKTYTDELVLAGIDEEEYYYYSIFDLEENAEDMRYDYLAEVLLYEIDFHTQAFENEIEETEEVED